MGLDSDSAPVKTVKKGYTSKRLNKIQIQPA